MASMLGPCVSGWIADVHGRWKKIASQLQDPQICACIQSNEEERAKEELVVPNFAVRTHIIEEAEGGSEVVGTWSYRTDVKFQATYHKVHNKEFNPSNLAAVSPFSTPAQKLRQMSRSDTEATATPSSTRTELSYEISYAGQHDERQIDECSEFDVDLFLDPNPLRSDPSNSRPSMSMCQPRRMPPQGVVADHEVPPDFEEAEEVHDVMLEEIQAKLKRNANALAMAQLELLRMRLQENARLLEGLRSLSDCEDAVDAVDLVRPRAESSVSTDSEKASPAPIMRQSRENTLIEEDELEMLGCDESGGETEM